MANPILAALIKAGLIKQEDLVAEGVDSTSTESTAPAAQEAQGGIDYDKLAQSILAAQKGQEQAPDKPADKPAANPTPAMENTLAEMQAQLTALAGRPAITINTGQQAEADKPPAMPATFDRTGLEKRLTSELAEAMKTGEVPTFVWRNPAVQAIPDTVVKMLDMPGNAENGYKAIKREVID